MAWSVPYYMGKWTHIHRELWEQAQRWFRCKISHESNRKKYKKGNPQKEGDWEKESDMQLIINVTRLNRNCYCYIQLIYIKWNENEKKKKSNKTITLHLVSWFVFVLTPLWYFWKVCWYALKKYQHHKIKRMARTRT